VVDLTDPRTVVWRNDPLILFHGTVVDSAASVIRRVRLPTGTRAGGWDFGRGVYLHISREAAEEWADSRADQRGQQPQVVEIAVDRAQFGALRSVVFLDAPSTYDPNDPFWQYVNFCRSRTDAGAGRRSQRTPSEADPYDIAMGPVVFLGHPPHREPYIERAAAPGVRARQRRFQICFKTEAAIALLNGSSRSLVGS
jgi:hypothetical protein